MVNDADAVATAEAVHGAGHGKAACVLTLTIGTGLGTTLHQDGVGGQPRVRPMASPHETGVLGRTPLRARSPTGGFDA